MNKRLSKFIFYLVNILCILTVVHQLHSVQDDVYDFAISKPFLEWMYNGHTIQPIIKITLTHRTSKVHTLPKDCEIHIAGTPADGLVLGWPNDIVIEPPNMCKYPPPGKSFSSETNLRNVVWPNYLDEKVMNKTCDVKGFLRIFTEHKGNSSDPANPSHVFEIHPVMSITTNGETLSFVNFLTAIKGMGHILPSTTYSCINNRKLYVRYNEDEEQYEFNESGGRCGNFAIVEVASVRSDWIRSHDGGHSAIARISPDGESRTTLKLYTLAGSGSDSWLQGIEDGNESSERKFLHELFTYDYFSIIKAVRTEQGDWCNDSNWKQVKFPLAFVVFGETDVVPWEE